MHKSCILLLFLSHCSPSHCMFFPLHRLDLAARCFNSMGDDKPDREQPTGHTTIDPQTMMMIMCTIMCVLLQMVTVAGEHNVPPGKQGDNTQVLVYPSRVNGEDVLCSAGQGTRGYRACRICCDARSDTAWVTEYGRCFHKRISCQGLCNAKTTLRAYRKCNCCACT